MSWLEFVVLALALTEVLEIWRHGEIFARLRSWLDDQVFFLARLVRCRFCLAPWLAWIWCLLLFLVLPALFPASPTDQQPPPVSLGLQATWVIFYGLAVARAANLINDLTHPWCRTPGSGANRERLPPTTDPLA